MVEVHHQYVVCSIWYVVCEKMGSISPYTTYHIPYTCMFEAFAVGPFLIWTHLVFLLIGVWLFSEFFFRLARSAQLSLEHFRQHALRYALAFALFGRLIAILAEFRVYKLDPLRVFIVWDGGFSFLGGTIGIAIVLYHATRSHRATFLQWLDVLLPASTFGIAFDWIGKFASGHAYGAPTDAFLGVTYDAMNVRYVVPIHPVQLYYAFFYFFLTFLLLVIRKREKRAGAETLFGICCASVVTFLLEYFRGDPSIPVFATKVDFVVLVALFMSLGIFAVIERSLSRKQIVVSEIILFVVFTGYFSIRRFLPFATMELRFSQFLAVMALLAAVVYVIVHRQKHPHL